MQRQHATAVLSILSANLDFLAENISGQVFNRDARPAHGKTGCVAPPRKKHALARPTPLN